MLCARVVGIARRFLVLRSQTRISCPLPNGGPEYTGAARAALLRVAAGGPDNRAGKPDEHGEGSGHHEDGGHLCGNRRQSGRREPMSDLSPSLDCNGPRE